MKRLQNHPILKFVRERKVTFTFEGQQLEGYESEIIAAALHAAGIKDYGYTAEKERARGFFCAIGKCSSCFVVVNGVPNTRACMTKLKEGMIIERQKGKGELWKG